jgi:demethylmenaquinone methyltransferase / 2-methoxy-6-polyprenyl-1,4-benzoquinol methylase
MYNNAGLAFISRTKPALAAGISYLRRYMAENLPHDQVVPFADSEKGKKQQVADMFDAIAFRYDFLNRFLSGGIDVVWRKKAIRELAADHPQVILDVATGTADVAIMTAKYLQPKRIVGIDISRGMLDLGGRKIEAAGLADIIQLQQGDAETINYPDDSFDAITVAFGVRNFENLRKGLTEMLRVLRPGGKLVILEFSKPKTAGFKGLYQLYMKMVAPGIVSLAASNKEAYQYLNNSVQAFPEGAALLAIMREACYTETTLKTLTLGICTIYCGRKPS